MHCARVPVLFSYITNHIIWKFNYNKLHAIKIFSLVYLHFGKLQSNTFTERISKISTDHRKRIKLPERAVHYPNTHPLKIFFPCTAFVIQSQKLKNILKHRWTSVRSWPIWRSGERTKKWESWRKGIIGPIGGFLRKITQILPRL